MNHLILNSSHIERMRFIIFVYMALNKCDICDIAPLIKIMTPEIIRAMTIAGI